MPFLRDDEAPTQAEREKMPKESFGDPENRTYPLDTDEHVRAAASYVEKEHSAGRLSDAKYKEIVARVNAAKKKRGIGDENKDSRSDTKLESVYRLDLASGTVGDRKKTPQGGIIANANLTRTGVFEYRDASGGKRRELRHPDEVFHPDSLATYPIAPLTVDHPGRVGPHNWKTHAVGTVGTDVRRNGDFVSGEVHIQHGDAMERAEHPDRTDGLSEISCGYTCDLDPTPGMYNGQPYDAVQRNIRINHVALGPAGWGRMGPDVKLHMDSSSAVSEPAEGGPYVRGRSTSRSPHEDTMSDQDKTALEKAQADKAKAEQELAQARADAASAKTEGERVAAELRAEKAKNASLEAQNQILTAQAERARNDGVSAEQKKAEEAAQQVRLEELIHLRADAAMVFATPEDTEGKKWKADGKNAEQIRREVLAHLEPTVKLDSLDGAGLKGVYEVAIAGKRRADKLRAEQLAATAGPRHDGKGGAGGDDDDDAPDAEKARKGMLDRKRDGWKQKKDRRASAR